MKGDLRLSCVAICFIPLKNPCDCHLLIFPNCCLILRLDLMTSLQALSALDSTPCLLLLVNVATQFQCESCPESSQQFSLQMLPLPSDGSPEMRVKNCRLIRKSTACMVRTEIACQCDRRGTKYIEQCFITWWLSWKCRQGITRLGRWRQHYLGQQFCAPLHYTWSTSY